MTAANKLAAKTEPAPAKRTVFISHANPEDNEAAAWFATRLALMGYEVWCDVRNTHGGETGFWLKVQNKIERDAIKFVYLLSETSRTFDKKKGIYKELQAATNLNLDNFVIPLRITKLEGTVPILINTDLYINAENWTEGLNQLVAHLRDANVPLVSKPDYKLISSWWPALSARTALVRDESSSLTSTIFPITRMPALVRIFKIWSEGNILAGRERVSQALPPNFPYSTHGEHVLSLANAADFQNEVEDFEIREHASVPIEIFLSKGWVEGGVSGEAALNMATYWFAAALEMRLKQKGLSSKPIPHSSRKIWFPAKDLLPKDNHSIAEPGRKKSACYLVGKVTSFRKEYFWHFGVQPVVDLRTHRAILMSPKAVITRPYNPATQAPAPIDEKKAAKALGWWNEHWRRRLLSLCAWLGDDAGEIVVSCGSSIFALASAPLNVLTPVSYRQEQDERLMQELLGGADD